jgi:hypothetical protein
MMSPFVGCLPRKWCEGVAACRTPANLNRLDHMDFATLSVALYLTIAKTVAVARCTSSVGRAAMQRVYARLPARYRYRLSWRFAWILTAHFMKISIFPEETIDYFYSDYAGLITPEYNSLPPQWLDISQGSRIAMYYIFCC